MWPAVLPENNEYPHAPWWHWEPGWSSNGCLTPVSNWLHTLSIGPGRTMTTLKRLEDGAAFHCSTYGL